MEIVVIILVLALVIFMFASMWKIFVKAGKPGWAALVPIYSTIVMLEIVGKPWWWFFLMMIPYVGMIWGIWTINLLSKSFGKDVGYTLGMLFLGFIFIPMLGFGDAQYQGPAAKEAQQA